MSKQSIGASVPFIDLPAQFKALKPQIDRVLGSIFEDASFISGPHLREFEDAFAQFVGAKHCVAVHSGTAALQLALTAAGIKPGDEVITVTNSFIASAEAISASGAVPRLVDCDANYFLIDPNQLEQSITSSTKAIIPVHLYGQPADMDKITEVAKRHNLKVIEDACQAHGATYRGRSVGVLGEVGCFSFYPGKNLGAAGDGGAVVTNDQTIATKVALMRDHGSTHKYEHEIVGHNFRLDSIQAAILNIKLPHLRIWNAQRAVHAQYYSSNLAGLRGIVVPPVAPEREHVFHLYVLKVSDRQLVEDLFNQRGIQYGIHYPTPIHLQKAYSQLGLRRGQFPVAERIAEQIISLPMFPEITPIQQDLVIDCLLEASKRLPEFEPTVLATK